MQKEYLNWNLQQVLLFGIQRNSRNMGRKDYNVGAREVKDNRRTRAIESNKQVSYGLIEMEAENIRIACIFTRFSAFVMTVILVVLWDS